MPYLELRLNTTDEAVDWVCTLLAATADIENLGITEYQPWESSDLLNETPSASNWTCTIQFYLADNGLLRSRVEKIAELLTPLHRTGLTTDLETTVVDRLPTAATAFVSRPIGQRFVVQTAASPPITLAQSTAAATTIAPLILRLPTSLAFGSGLHPATVVCLRLLERSVKPGMAALDLGCGSGILSVAIAQLGGSVLAIDNDPVAIKATQEAVQLNRVTSQVTVQLGSLGPGSGLGHWMGGETPAQVPMIQAAHRFDLIVANILARVHGALAQDYHQALRDRHGYGLLIAAGFTADQEETVTASFQEAGFELCDREQLNEWVALVAQIRPVAL